MKPDLQRLPQPWMTEGPAAEVMRALTAEGEQARFVGGCVRDALVGRNIRDIDIATPLSPQRVTELLRKAGLKAVPTGIDHGTITAVADKTGVEVTTLRRDVETDGRRAKVEFTDNWQADAARRDLTINALSADATGKVHDYFGGLDDLGAGRVRFVGDPKQRIVEDYLRLLRFFRFHADYASGVLDDLGAGRVRFVGDPKQRIVEDYLRLLRFFRFHADYATGGLDEAAVAAAKELAPNLKSLSGERLRQETLRLLTARRGPDVWGEMLGLGIVQHYLPWATSLDRLRWVAELEQRHGVTPDAIRRLAALTMTGCGREVAETLKLSRAEGDRVIALDATRDAFDASSPQAVRRQIYAWGNDGARDRLLLDWLDRIDGAAGGAALAIIESWPRPRFPIKGVDIVKMGVPEGPRVGELLERAENWWIERDFTPDRAACLVFARNQV